ncbi:unnamed protein product, partial [Nesidiocoris tenuis]
MKKKIIFSILAPPYCSWAQPLTDRPRTDSSERLFVKCQSTEIMFLIDTGATTSLIPNTNVQRLGLNTDTSDRLITAANGSAIQTFGAVSLSICLGKSFKWKFVSGDLKFGIIGMDFLSHFGFEISTRHHTLNHQGTNIPTISCSDSNLESGSLAYYRTDPAISQVQGIMSNFEKLINKVNLTPVPSTQGHALLDELVTTTLLKLDDVDISSHASDREVRKSAINQVMHFANLLDKPTVVLGEKGHLSEPSDVSSRPKKHSADFPSTSTNHRELSTLPYMKRKTTTHNDRPNIRRMPTRLKSSPADVASAAIRPAQHSSGLALHHPSPLQSDSPSRSVSTDSQHWTRESLNH